MAIAYTKRVILPRPIEPGEKVWMPATLRPENHAEFWTEVTILRVLGNGRFEIGFADDSTGIVLGENLYERRFR